MKKITNIKRIILSAAVFGLTVVCFLANVFWGAQAAGTISGRVFQDFNGNGSYDTTLTVTNNGFGTTGAAIDRGVASVAVTAYDSSGTARGTASTAADGTYSLVTSGTGPYRVEFTNLPTGFLPSARTTDSIDGGTATNSGSTVQFVSPTSGTPIANVNLAVNYPADYSQNNPEVTASLYMSGDQAGISAPVLVSFPYSAGSTDATPGATESAFDQPVTPTLGLGADEVGTTYGLTYARKSRLIYAGAYFKRHAGFGPGGPNRIYVINRTGAGSVTNAFTVPGTATNAHDTTNYPRDNDNTGWNGVGKTSLGGLVLSEDESTLYVFNLANRTLYSLNPATGAQIAANATLPTLPVNTGNCGAADRQPFALSVYHGTLYAGFVCSAESSATVDTFTDANGNGQYDGGDNYIETNGTPGRQTGESYQDLNGNGAYDAGEAFVDNDGNGFYNLGDARKLYAYVFTVNPTTLAYSASPVFSMPLNYRRGITTHSQGAFGVWRPWSAIYRNASTVANRPTYAQPMLTDIAFDNGNLVLGLRDRLSDQVGNGSLSNPGDASNTTLYQPRTAGDIIRACGSVGAWTLESNGRCGGGGTAPQNSGEGPGGGEFYYGDSYDLTEDVLTPAATISGKGGNHDDTASGGVEQLPGAPDVIFSNFDPIPSIANMTHDGGVRWANNTTGNFAKAYRIFNGNGNDAGVFGKAGGIGGSLAILPDPAPIELGNRVWNDTDGDGVQDAGETGISGVTIQLYQGSTFLAAAVTDAAGEYYFSAATGTNTTNAKYGLNIQPATAYQIRLDNATNYNSGGVLNNLLLTRRDETTQSGFADGSDSDASLITNPSGSAAGTFAVISLTTGNVGENNHTFDFGFAASAVYSLGNRVWYDTNNDGMINTGEVGISGVSVSVLNASTSAVVNTVATDSSGYYRFDGLAAGSYIVRVNAANFTGVTLAGYQNTTGSTSADLDSTSVAGQNGEDGINPTVANSVRANGIVSNTIILGAPGEPTNEADVAAAGQGAVDAAANMTADFGFYRACLSGTIWNDNGNGVAANKNNAILNAGENGIASVRVQIYNSANTEIIVGADGILGTADDGANGMLTNSGGNYNFCGLPTGQFRIVVTPTAGTSSTDISTTANPDNNVDSDDNGVTGTAPFAGKTVSNLVTLTPGNAGALSNNTVTNSNGLTANPTIDFGFVLPPSAINLDKFDAYIEGGQVYINWLTGDEAGNLGFNVYRETNGRRELLTRSPIAGSSLRGTVNLEVTGDGYGWVDSNPNAGAVYWLEDLDLQGNKTLHGPVSPTLKFGWQTNAPIFKTLSDLTRVENPSAEREYVGEAASNTDEKTERTAQRRFQLMSEGVKISVKRDGLYHVSADQLQSAGFNVNSDPNNWQLLLDGREIPLKLNGDNSIEFFGRALDNLQTDTQAYFLVAGNLPGRRVETVVSDGETEQYAASYPLRVERRDHSFYLSGLLNGEATNWYGALVLTANPTLQTLTVHDLDASQPIRLAVKLQGYTAGEHLVSVRFNDFDLGAVSLSNQANQRFEFNLPASAVVEGANTIRLQSIGTGNDISLTDTLALDYSRAFRAVDNQLRFTVPANQNVKISGFDSANVKVFEISKGEIVRQIRVSADANGEYFIAAAAANRELFALTADNFAASPTVEKLNSTNWRAPNNEADFVIVTPRLFRPQAEQLAARRQAQGINTTVVPIEEIYNEFNYGVRSLDAIRAFLNNAAANWNVKPRYALLFGDSSYDSRNYLALPDRNLIPTKLIDTEFMESASDGWLADFDGDGIEDIALGRFPVGTTAEADAMLAKIARYEAQTASDKSNLFVSDNGFEGYAGQVQAQLPAAVASSRLDRSAMTDPEMHTQIIARANQGPSVVTYFGHGSSGVWSGLGLFNNNDALTLNNDHLSVYLLMTCLNGFTHNPSGGSMAESVLTANGGAVAVWASSGETRPNDQFLINAAATTGLFDPNNAMRFGDIFRLAKQNATETDVRRTWMLFGDPTMRLR